MSCITSDSPIDITLKNNSGICDLKCEYKFNYHSSTCTVNNRGEYLSLTYDDKSASAAPAYYNSEPYNVSEVRLYSPSLHTFNGEKAVSEIIVVHDPIKGGKQLLVCTPVKINPYKTNKQDVGVDTIVDAASKNAPTDGDSFTIPIQKNIFSLNNFIPKASFFSYTAIAPYSPCSDKVNVVIFSPQESIVEMSKSSVLSMSQILTPNSYTIKTNTPFYYNKTGSTGSSTEGEIYIDCQPVGASKEKITPVPDDGGGGEGRWWKDAWFKDMIGIILGVIISIIIFIIFSYLFKMGVNVEKFNKAVPTSAQSESN